MGLRVEMWKCLSSFMSDKMATGMESGADLWSFCVFLPGVDISHLVVFCSQITNGWNHISHYFQLLSMYHSRCVESERYRSV